MNEWEVLIWGRKYVVPAVQPWTAISRAMKEHREKYPRFLKRVGRQHDEIYVKRLS